MEGGPTMPDEKAEASDRLFKEFFLHVGYAITRWAHVDRALFELCRFALNASDEKTAAVFHKFKSISDHHVLTDDLLALSLSKSNMTRWAPISSELRRLLPYRNRIAHDPAIEIIHLYGFVGEPSPETIERLSSMEPQQWWVIAPEESKLLNKKKVSQTASQELMQEDIVTHIRDVNRLLSKVWELQRQLPKKPLKKPQVSPGQAPSQGKRSKRNSARNRARPRSRPQSSPA
jgi:hypothetical protein